MKVISNANPAGTPSGSDGRANVLIKNCNYIIDKLSIRDEVARGAVGNELIITGAQGRCYIGELKVNAEVAGTGVSILAATSPTVIESLKLANGVNNGVAAYVGTEYLQGGSTVVNTLNTPTTITIP